MHGVTFLSYSNIRYRVLLAVTSPDQNFSLHLFCTEPDLLLRMLCLFLQVYWLFYEGHLESKERFAIKKYLLITEKKNNMQVLSHTFTYFST